MTQVSLVDVTVHVDAALDKTDREELDASLRELNGVVSVRIADETPHLALVEYVPEVTNSEEILACVTLLNGRAELVGL